MKISSVLAGLAAAVALCLWAGTASAQNTPPPASAATCPAGQQGTSIRCVGDWQVRCFQVQGQQRCDMYQELANKASGQPVLSLSIAYIPTAQGRAMQIVVPLMVSIPKGLIVSTDGYTSAVMRYRACERTGCFVAQLADQALLNGLSHGGDVGHVQIASYDGKPANLSFSLKGFSGALDLMTQSTAKGKTDAAAPAAPAPAAP